MSNRKYSSLEDVWNQHQNKLCVFVVEAVDLAGKQQNVYCKVSVGKKTIGKTNSVNSMLPKWEDLIFAGDLDSADILTIEVYSGSVFLGQASIASLQELEPQDEVIDKWIDLTPRPKKKDIVSGKIHVRVIYSTTPESRSLMKNREAKDIHFHAFYRHLFKTGDLITYNAVGILSSITKLVTNAPFSQVGLILNLPNKYTKKEELYVLEVTRNIDKFVDVFTEEKDSGVCIFRLIERLHQFPGHAIWWSPLNRPSEEKKVNEMLSWLWDVYKNGKNPNKKGRITKELRAKGPALRLLMEKFDLGKTESELCELASCDLVTKCLIRLGQVSEDSVHGVPTPLDIVNFPCYSKPVLIRVKMKYFNEQMLPPGVNLTQLTKDISTRPMELELSETLTKQNSRIETRNQTLPVSTTNGKKYLIPFTEIVIQKEIGEGSYGKVYVGHWKGNLVALKFCKKRGELEDFMKEVNLMIDLPSHPNIVLMLGVSLDGPQPVIVMEYCNGGGLDKLLVESNVKLSDEYKIRLVRGIAAGMLHLHKHNIIHRDLAARNILLTASGDPKISDFGMSRILKPTEIGKTKSNVGPVCWMAPESLAKGSYSKQSDVWMFGIVVYEIVAQTEPHKDKDMIDIAIQIQSKGLTPEIPSDCPEKLRQLMEMCWKKEPEQRPSFETICSMLGN